MVFKEMDINDSAYLEHLSKCQHVPSDCTAATIYGYSEIQHIKRAYSHGLCWQKGVDFGGLPFYFPPIGDWLAADWKAIFNEVITDDMEFMYIPEALKTILESQFPNNLLIEDCRDEYDYLYSIEENILAKGKQFAKIRNRRLAFQKSYSFKIREIIDDDIPQLVMLQENSYNENFAHDTNIAELDAEAAAFTRIIGLLNNQENLRSICIEIDNKIAGFIVYEIVKKTLAVSIFMKVDKEYKGLSEFLELTMYKDLSNHGIITLNDMADVGVEGLRISKMRKNPQCFLKKYRIRISRQR